MPEPQQKEIRKEQTMDQETLETSEIKAGIKAQGLFCRSQACCRGLRKDPSRKRIPTASLQGFPAFTARLIIKASISVLAHKHWICCPALWTHPVVQIFPHCPQQGEASISLSESWVSLQHHSQHQTGNPKANHPPYRGWEQDGLDQVTESKLTSS